MVSISSSSASLSAVRVLQSVNAQLDTTQSRISTGLKVASAKDGAAAWSAAATIRSEISTNDALRAGIDVSKTAADVASASADQIVSALTEMRTAVIAYGNTSNAAEQAVYASKVAAAQQNILTALASSKSGDLDWLNNTATAITVNVGAKSDGTLVSQTYTPAVNVTTDLGTTVIDATDANAAITAIASFTTAGIPKIVAALDTAITNVSTVSANLGALSDNLSSAKDFLAKIADIKSTALSNLVDADMEEESARLSALQVRQQLATQAISIANSSSQNVLRLFQ